MTGGMASASAQFIDKYLAAPPYHGHSNIAHSAFIKGTIAGTGGFDRSKGPNGMWHTSHVHTLIDLVGWGKFQPFGIEPKWNAEFLERARTYAADAEATWLSNAVEARLNRSACEEDTNIVDKKRKLEVPLRPESPAPLTDREREALRAKAKADQAEKITGNGGGKRPRNAVSSSTLRKQQAAASRFFMRPVA